MLEPAEKTGCLLCLLFLEHLLCAASVKPYVYPCKPVTHVGACATTTQAWFNAERTAEQLLKLQSQQVPSFVYSSLRWRCNSVAFYWSQIQAMKLDCAYKRMNTNGEWNRVLNRLQRLIESQPEPYQGRGSGIVLRPNPVERNPKTTTESQGTFNSWCRIAFDQLVGFLRITNLFLHFDWWFHMVANERWCLRVGFKPNARSIQHERVYVLHRQVRQQYKHVKHVTSGQGVSLLE